MRAKSTRAYTLVDQTLETPYTVDTSLQFEECEWDTSPSTIRLKVIIILDDLH